MKLLTTLIMAMMIAGVACADDHEANWKKRYGLDPSCTNPVFTRPNRMNANERMEGAGICMNDGLAYTNRYAGFSSDWHYEPKLGLCQKEADAMPRVVAMLPYQPYQPGENGEPLKFCVVPHHGCGATVVYRTFRIWRTSKYQTIEQFIAVYDSEGNLTDCMTMAMEVGEERHNDLVCALLVEPHKQYAVPNNRGNLEMTFDEDGNGFTINRFWMLNDNGSGVPSNLDFSQHFTITPQGKIQPGKATAVKDGALLADVANPMAVELYELLHAPMSDATVLQRLEALTPKGIANAQMHDLLVHVAMMQLNRNPSAYVNYAYDRRSVSAPGLTRLLKEAGNLDSDNNVAYRDRLPQVLEKCDASDAAKRYCFRALGVYSDD